MKSKKKENICEICGKPYEYALSVSIIDGVKTCKHDSDVKKNSLSLKRHTNYDLSAEALKLAAFQKQITTEVNPEVEVKSYQKGSEGRTEKIPKKVIDSIIEKVKDEEALQE